MNAVVISLLAVRAASVAVGGYAVHLGHDLYLKGVAGVSDASLTWDNQSFWIKGAAPGLFFAMLGTAIIVVTITRKLRIEHQTPGGKKLVFSGRGNESQEEES